MRARITELFGIKHPIIQGGMHRVGYTALAARMDPYRRRTKCASS